MILKIKIINSNLKKSIFIDSKKFVNEIDARDISFLKSRSWGQFRKQQIQISI